MYFSNNSSLFIVISALYVIFSQFIITSYSAPFSSHLQKRAFSGSATYYEPGLGACGVFSSRLDLIIAVNAAQFGNTPNPNQNPICGKRVIINGPKGTITCRVVDRCPGCSFGDLDLSPTAFEKIANLDQGRVQITWDFIN
ncbi:10671_t:CDS:1 [Funneliformis caledonium]|uniref:10671_t:CDS:1 n=1 Tax=Funneliformis caledonium TaxID=1117310 RepID=A0A9N8ZH79_9GLOM|nr:10671_t:CDS:1 [Funneliformis caledonium]